MRKLKKRSNKPKIEPNPDDTNTVIVTDGEKKIIVKRRKKKIYVKQQCAYIIKTKDGERQCKRKAVGKSTLCERHGGNRIIKENLLEPLQEKYLIDERKTSVFNPATHPIDFINLSRHGASEVEIASEFGISTQTLQQWVEKYDSFNTAYEVGKAMHEAWWIRQGKDNLNERNFNTPLYKYLTMNKLGYSDKIEQKNINTNIHGVLVIPDKMTADEWENEVIDVDS